MTQTMMVYVTVDTDDTDQLDTIIEEMVERLEKVGATVGLDDWEIDEDTDDEDTDDEDEPMRTKMRRVE